jgi:Ca2+-binding EF-hand superfamily protein
VDQADREARQAQRFARLDANGDGQVTPAEFDAARDRREQAGEQHNDQSSDQRRDAWFARLDSDKSGGLSQAELAAGRGQRGERDAAGTDPAGKDKSDRGQRAGWRQGDGPREGGMMIMHMADANHDGSLTRAEFDSAQQRQWTMVDSDRDGRITAAEMTAARERMMAAHHTASPPAPAD